ncbi:GntR family transcriptional regulator [Actinomyces faecalis]|uniref:GntR family transcriptional regulator n=1 Tax=Actinomyces faecalis TaxID=2722820 RepID=UPI0015566536|nr:GntR family transcriptional regulator [Actinomyces faecalis]
MTSTPRLDLTVDPAAADPVFAQICQELRRQVDQGTLPVGARLPATRALAEQLGLAVNTVAKAYRTLEAEGVIEGRGRSGTFVRDQRGSQAQQAASAFVTRMRALGVSEAEAAELLRRAWKA